MVPWLTVTCPVKGLLPVSVSVPVPVFTKPPEFRSCEVTVVLATPVTVRSLPFRSIPTPDPPKTISPAFATTFVTFPNLNLRFNVCVTVLLLVIRVPSGSMPYMYTGLLVSPFRVYAESLLPNPCPENRMEEK